MFKNGLCGKGEKSAVSDAEWRTGHERRYAWACTDFSEQWYYEAGGERIYGGDFREKFRGQREADIAHKDKDADGSAWRDGGSNRGLSGLDLPEKISLP